jgi:hypothetical protein
MPLAMKWTSGLILLGAGYLVAAHPNAFATLFGSAQKFVSGTEATAIGR